MQYDLTRVIGNNIAFILCPVKLRPIILRMSLLHPIKQYHVLSFDIVQYHKTQNHLTQYDCSHHIYHIYHIYDTQSLAIELFKVKQNLSNSMLCSIFQKRSVSSNLRSQIDFIRSNANTTQYELKHQ